MFLDELPNIRITTLHTSYNARAMNRKLIMASASGQEKFIFSFTCNTFIEYSEITVKHVKTVKNTNYLFPRKNIIVLLFSFENISEWIQF